MTESTKSVETTSSKAASFFVDFKEILEKEAELNKQKVLERKKKKTSASLFIPLEIKRKSKNLNSKNLKKPQDEVAGNDQSTEFQRTFTKDDFDKFQKQVASAYANSHRNDRHKSLDCSLGHQKSISSKGKSKGGVAPKIENTSLRKNTDGNHFGKGKSAGNLSKDSTVKAIRKSELEKNIKQFSNQKNCEQSLKKSSALVASDCENTTVQPLSLNTSEDTFKIVELYTNNVCLANIESKSTNNIFPPIASNKKYRTQSAKENKKPNKNMAEKRKIISKKPSQVHCENVKSTTKKVAKNKAVKKKGKKGKKKAPSKENTEQTEEITPAHCDEGIDQIPLPHCESSDEDWSDCFHELFKESLIDNPCNVNDNTANKTTVPWCESVESNDIQQPHSYNSSLRSRSKTCSTNYMSIQRKNTDDLCEHDIHLFKSQYFFQQTSSKQTEKRNLDPLRQTRKTASLDRPVFNKNVYLSSAVGSVDTSLDSTIEEMSHVLFLPQIMRNCGLSDCSSSSENITPRPYVRSVLGNTAVGKDIYSSSSCTDSVDDSHVEVIEWQKGKLIDKGAFGAVYQALTSQGHLIAIKEVQVGINQNMRKIHKRLAGEIGILKALKHPNIIKFMGTSLEENCVCIFMEYIPGGSIAGLIASFGRLNESIYKRYTKQIVHAVHYLHGQGVVHRDIKGANILVTVKGLVKLIDFGCAKELSLSLGNTVCLRSVKGTPYWMSPEVIQGTGCNHKSDIWSIGCTVIEMAHGRPPWSEYEPYAAMFAIAQDNSTPPVLDNLNSEGARNFVEVCLTREKENRPSAEDLLSHPFIYI